MPQNRTDVADEIRQEVEQWNASRPKPINTMAHGIVDYALGSTLLFAPEVFGFPEEGAASAVPRIQGAATLGLSAMTRYELGLRPMVPMKTHLIVDAVSGLFLALSPWILGFGKLRKKSTWMPHLAVAMAEMVVVALSDDRSRR